MNSKEETLLNPDLIRETDLPQGFALKDKLALLMDNFKYLVNIQDDNNKEPYVGYLHKMQQLCEGMLIIMEEFKQYSLYRDVIYDLGKIHFNLTQLLLLSGILRSNYSQYVTTLISNNQESLQNIRNRIHALLHSRDPVKIHTFSTISSEYAELMDLVFTQGWFRCNSFKEKAHFFYHFSMIDATCLKIARDRLPFLLTSEFSQLNGQELHALRTLFIARNKLPLLQLLQESNTGHSILKDSDIFKELVIRAIHDNSLACLQYLFTFEGVSPHDLTYLEEAAIKDHFDIFKFLFVGKSISPEVKELLEITAIRHSLEITQYLLSESKLNQKEIEKKVARHFKSENENTNYLIEAAKFGNLATVKYLIESCKAPIERGYPIETYERIKRQSLESISDKEFITPLVSALRNGHFEVAQYLLQKINGSKIQYFNLHAVVHEVLLALINSDSLERLSSIGDRLVSFVKKEAPSCNYFEQPRRLEALCNALEYPIFHIDSTNFHYDPSSNTLINAPEAEKGLAFLEVIIKFFPDCLASTNLSKMLQVALCSKPQTLISLAKQGVIPPQKESAENKFPSWESTWPLQMALSKNQKNQFLYPNAPLALLEAGMCPDVFLAKECLIVAAMMQNELLAAWVLQYFSSWHTEGQAFIHAFFHKLLANGCYSHGRLLTSFIHLGNYRFCREMLPVILNKWDPSIIPTLWQWAFTENSIELVHTLLHATPANQLFFNESHINSCLSIILVHDDVSCLEQMLNINNTIYPMNINIFELFNSIKHLNCVRLSEFMKSHYPILSQPCSPALPSGYQHFSFFSGAKDLGAASSMNEFDDLFAEDSKDMEFDDGIEEHTPDLFFMPSRKRKLGDEPSETGEKEKEGSDVKQQCEEEADEQVITESCNKKPRLS